MQYLIKNPTQDMNGNVKENIFIAYDDQGNVLGNAYVYPAINHYQTYETPHMIYFDVHIGIENEDICKDSLQLELFDAIITRAKSIRKEREDLKTRLYTGCINDTYKLRCLKEKGFDDDCTIIMSLDNLSESYQLSEKTLVKNIDLNNKSTYKRYEEVYNNLFITPITLDMVEELQSADHFSCKEVTVDDHTVGGYTIYTDESVGYIETLFVHPDYIGKGHSKTVMESALSELQSLGVKSVELEVWKSNERAVHLYEGYGFKEIAANIMFPSLTL